MSLFDKKYCDVCGEKISLLGNRKLEDGNLCKNCASKLSPWFSDRRHSALADIKRQLEDREANRDRVSAFCRSQKLGNDGLALYLDERKDNFAVCYESDWKNGNPDILPLSSIINCRYESAEHKTERKHKDAEGKSVSYNPPVYDYSYDFYIVIDVNHPYIDEIKFRVNSMTLSRNGGSLITGGDRKIIECEDLCKQIVEQLYACSRGSAPQNDLTLVIPQFKSPFRVRNLGGAYEMVVRLYVKGTVTVRVTDTAMQNENMAMEYIRDVINRTIMQLELADVDVHTVDAALLNGRLMQVIGGNGLQQFGLETKDTNLILNIDPEDMKLLERMATAAHNLNTVNTAATPTASASHEWLCTSCNSMNAGGKFCTNCGTPRP